MDPLSVGRYELVMGPGSVLYGSDAIGGVLNAFTIEPPDWTHEPAWERRVYYRGSTAERSHIGRLQLGGRLDERIGFVGGYSVKTFGDLSGGKDMGVQDHTGYDEQDFDAKVNWFEVTKRNAGDGYVQGIEVSELYRFTPQWSARLTASWQDGKVDTYSSSAAAEKRRESISRLMPPTAECGLRWQSDPRSEYWCELVGSAADKADKLSADDRLDTQRIPPGGTPGYVVCHVRGGARLTDALTLNMAVENVFDEDYRIHGSGVNEPGRNVILTAMCEF